jgi:hypothetical protein
MLASRLRDRSWRAAKEQQFLSNQLRFLSGHGKVVEDQQVEFVEFGDGGFEGEVAAGDL